jgi:hypothetical protein
MVLDDSLLGSLEQGIGPLLQPGLVTRSAGIVHGGSTESNADYEYGEFSRVLQGSSEFVFRPSSTFRRGSVSIQGLLVHGFVDG